MLIYRGKHRLKVPLHPLFGMYFRPLITHYLGHVGHGVTISKATTGNRDVNRPFDYN